MGQSLFPFFRWNRRSPDIEENAVSEDEETDEETSAETSGNIVHSWIYRLFGYFRLWRPSAGHAGVSVPEDGGTPEIEIEDIAGNEQTTNIRRFSLAKIKNATRLFSDCIGRGGFGKVYKGVIEETTEIAVKRQDLEYGHQSEEQFYNEIGVLLHLHHPNIIKLIGYCDEGEERILVYEFMRLGSLDSHLHDLKDENQPLDWNARMRVATGVARALNYLHTKVNPPVIFRDLKVGNILLDKEYHPKLSDFGIAVQVTTGQESPDRMGTPPYLAPELKLSFKVDVYSFGVLLLVIITGQKSLDPNHPKGKYITDRLRPQLQDDAKFVELADPQLNGQFPSETFIKVIKLSISCMNPDPNERPSITEVEDYMNRLTYQP